MRDRPDGGRGTLRVVCAVSVSDYDSAGSLHGRHVLHGGGVEDRGEVLDLLVDLRHLTMTSIGTFSSDDFTVTASFTVGELRTGASSWICLLTFVTSSSSSGCANNPASMNLGLNSWTKSKPSPQLVVKTKDVFFQDEELFLELRDPRLLPPSALPRHTSFLIHLIGYSSPDNTTWKEVSRVTLTGSPEKLLLGVFGIGNEPTTNGIFFEALRAGSAPR
jgi:hypothetical protein